MVDGWPIIGEDIDGDGIGEMVWGGVKPIEGCPIVVPSKSDDFNDDRLGEFFYCLQCSNLKEFENR